MGSKSSTRKEKKVEAKAWIDSLMEEKRRRKARTRAVVKKLSHHLTTKSVPNISTTQQVSVAK